MLKHEKFDEQRSIVGKYTIDPTTMKTVCILNDTTAKKTGISNVELQLQDMVNENQLLMPDLLNTKFAGVSICDDKYHYNEALGKAVAYKHARIQLNAEEIQTLVNYKKKVANFMKKIDDLIEVKRRKMHNLIDHVNKLIDKEYGKN